MSNPYSLTAVFQSTLSVWRGTSCGEIMDYSLGDFNPPSPCGEGPMHHGENRKAVRISIHPLRVERDELLDAIDFVNSRFQSTLSVWRGTKRKKHQNQNHRFQSTLSVWRGTPSHYCNALRERDFNPPSPCGEGLSCSTNGKIKQNFNPPSPCGEGHDQTLTTWNAHIFQSTLSVWRGTVHQCDYGSGDLFQSTLSVWRGTVQAILSRIVCLFQSTLSVWRGTKLGKPAIPSERISIHPLRVERDSKDKSGSCGGIRFQSTLSVWRGTCLICWADI